MEQNSGKAGVGVIRWLQAVTKKHLKIFFALYKLPLSIMVVAVCL